MTDREKVIEALKSLAKPVSKGDVAKFLNFDKKIIDKIFSDLQKEDLIISSVRCKWELKNK